MASFSLGYVTSVLLCSSEGKPCVVSIVALTVLCGGFLYGLLYFDLEVPKYKPQAPECAEFCRISAVNTVRIAGTSFCEISESC